ncbi:hypothetical protein CPB86DRAFT_814148 [Serendipita vermifera]|nr:hypothetical protein CPB86DRAFT_814148 [Serendipita vermifera]
MSQCLSFTDHPEACAGPCIEASIANQNAPRISMTISTEILLTDFEIGRSMNFTWSYWAQFWRPGDEDETSPAQFSSLIEDMSFTEDPLNRVVGWGNFHKMEHRSSLVVPSDRIVGLSISATYPSPIVTSQELKFTMHSISLIFDGAAVSSTSSPPNSPSSSEGNILTSPSTQLLLPSSTDLSAANGELHKYTASQMGILGGTLGAVIVTLLAAWYLIRRWEERTGRRFQLKTGFGMIAQLWSEDNKRTAASRQ